MDRPRPLGSSPVINVVDAFPTDADLIHLARCVELAQQARDAGNHPFGSVLVGPDGTVLAEAGNTVGTTGDVTGHAETNLVRIATTAVDRALMAGSTLYSSAEPCAMCAGATYWSHVGRLAYALSEADLFKSSARTSATRRCRCRAAACSRPGSAR